MDESQISASQLRFKIVLPKPGQLLRERMVALLPVEDHSQKPRKP